MKNYTPALNSEGERKVQEYRDALTAAGLVISGLSPDGRLVETVELRDHPFFVGVQFHPEFKSRPNRPHPLFLRGTDLAQRRVCRREARGRGRSD